MSEFFVCVASSDNLAVLGEVTCLTPGENFIVCKGGYYNDGDSASGAYVFRPATDNRLRLESNNKGAQQNKKVSVVFRTED